MSRVVISEDDVTLLARALLTVPASERDTLAWIICHRALDAAHAARAPGAVRSPYGDGTLAAAIRATVPDLPQMEDFAVGERADAIGVAAARVSRLWDFVNGVPADLGRTSSAPGASSSLASGARPGGATSGPWAHPPAKQARDEKTPTWEKVALACLAICAVAMAAFVAVDISGIAAPSFDDAMSDWTDSLDRFEEAVGALD